jgi:hypothetical protein
MKTALTIHPHWVSPDLKSLGDLVHEIRLLAIRCDQPVKIHFQNNLKNGTLAIMVELEKKTLGGVGRTFLQAAKITLKDIKRFNAQQLRQKAKQAARAAHSERRRRANSAR